jgi:nucleoside-diphosphate-sugar epimerase
MICWITPWLGTGPFGVDKLSDDVYRVDIRALVDKAGNSTESLVACVRTSLSAINRGERVVICCDHGISRSNAIAAAVLSQHERITFSESVRRVLSATGNAEIRLDVLETVRHTFFCEDSPPVNSKVTPWLVTGGHGYLGTALANSAPRGTKLLRPTHSELDLVSQGVAIDLFVREHRVSKIVHFATPHVSNTNSSLGASITMLRNVLDACVSNDIPLVVPSRWEVFGGYKGQQILAKEDTPLAPLGVLGDAKYLSEKLIEQFVRRSNVRVTILRSGLVYGGESAPNFLRSFIRRANAHEEIITHTYENGPPKLDMISLEDWVAACWSLIGGEGQTGVYHCGSGDLTSTREIAEIVVQTMGSASKIKLMPLNESIANVALDSEKLKRDFRWMPKTSIFDGIREFVRRSAEELAFRGINQNESR